jgi:hypothetical protein
MIIKVQYNKIENKIYFKSKPSHNGRDRQYIIDHKEAPSGEMLNKLQGKRVGYFHAHMKEDSLVVDDKIDDQMW